MTTTSKAKMPLAELYALWAKLGDIPTGLDSDDVDCLEESFLHFSAGIPRENVWHWFEQQHPAFVTGDVMQGIRREDVLASEAAAAPAVDTSHWSYVAGHKSGRTRDLAERGIMAFGLDMASDETTRRNVILWLAGFDAGIAEVSGPNFVRPRTWGDKAPQ